MHMCSSFYNMITIRDAMHDEAVDAEHRLALANLVISAAFI